MIEITKPLVEFANRLSIEYLPASTIEHSRMFIADYIAASIAGYKINFDFNNKIRSVIDEEGASEQSSVLLSRKKYSVAQAAFLNAIYAHGADMDDGNKKSAGHIGTHVIPAVFALAEYKNAQWKDVFLAIIVGYDIFNRVAGAAQPSLYNKGFHSTGIAGSVACAAACAKLLNLSSKQIYNSISIAAVQSSGLIIIDESAQHCKPINPGNAARIGVLSALMAEKGLDAPRNPLESKKGWFHAFSDNINEEVLFGDLGSVFTIDESYIKQYPSCRHTHSCIDAIKDIRVELDKLGLSYHDIKSIDVNVYPSAIKSAGNIKYPQTSGEAKFSIHYAIAKALLTGGFSLDDLNGYIDEEISSIIDKITLIPDDALENRLAGIRGCNIKVVLYNNNELEKTVLVPKGEGEYFLTWDDLEQKMLSCSRDVISTEESKEIIRQCKNICIHSQYEQIKIQEPQKYEH